MGLETENAKLRHALDLVSKAIHDANGPLSVLNNVAAVLQLYECGEAEREITNAASKIVEILKDCRTAIQAVNPGWQPDRSK